MQLSDVIAVTINVPLWCLPSHILASIGVFDLFIIIGIAIPAVVVIFVAVVVVVVIGVVDAILRDFPRDSDRIARAAAFASSNSRRRWATTCDNASALIERSRSTRDTKYGSRLVCPLSNTDMCAKPMMAPASASTSAGPGNGYCKCMSVSVNAPATKGSSDVVVSTDAREGFGFAVCTEIPCIPSVRGVKMSFDIITDNSISPPFSLPFLVWFETLFFFLVFCNCYFCPIRKLEGAKNYNSGFAPLKKLVIVKDGGRNFSPRSQMNKSL